jgi:hypothetical protein
MPINVIDATNPPNPPTVIPLFAFGCGYFGSSLLPPAPVPVGVVGIGVFVVFASSPYE